MFRKRRVPRHLILDDRHPTARYQLTSHPRRFSPLWLSLSAVAVLSLLAALSEAAAMAESGQLLMRPVTSGHERIPNTEPHSHTNTHTNTHTNSPDYRPALHLDSEVHFEISGMVAKVSLAQRFSNRSPHWSEAVYVFPLPETAAVNAMEMHIGERVIRGEIHEKQSARHIYQQAKQSGRTASLVEQQRPNLFTQKVANIAPGETIEVHLGYIQKVDYRQGRFSLRFPMTLTPRYNPGLPDLSHSTANTETITLHSGWGVPTDQVPDGHRITPPMLPVAGGEPVNPITLTATLDAGLPLANISSDYHNLNLRREGALHHIALAEKQVSMDRDFVLRWKPVAHKAPTAAVFNEEVNGEHYAMVMLLPPDHSQRGNRDQHQRLPREMVFVIDTSGSMGGTSIRQAKQSLQLAIDRLRPDDKFNIVEFNSQYRRLFPASVPAEPRLVRQAQIFVAGLEAGGGTEMAPAISAALSLPEHPSHLKQVVFITDGSVGNERALFAQIQQQLGSARLFTVGIGSAPNSFFMRKAAQFGRGSHTYVGAQDEVQEKMSDLFSQLESPVLGDIHLSWPDANQPVEFWPEKLPDLYMGEPLVITAKLPAASSSVQGALVMGGRVAGGDRQWQQTLALDNAKAHAGVANLWARDKIAALMDRKTSGVDEADIKPQVLAVALAHQLVSAYTSFVAVEEQVSRPLDHPIKSKPIPNAVAKGQQLLPIAYPRTATPGPVHLAISALCLALALLLYWHSEFTRSREGNDGGKKMAISV